MRHVRLGPADASQLYDLAGRLLEDVTSFEDVASLKSAAAFLADLPDPVRQLAGSLRANGGDAVAILVSGVEFGTLRSLPTPSAIGEYESDDRSRLASAVLFLLGATLGTPFCFASQQRARLFLDVFPLAGHEDDQLGCSSTTRLEWHNEDAFHPLRAGYSLLMCIRNGQSAATRIVAARDLRLDDDVVHQLSKPQFAIVPDVSHTYSYNATTSGVAAGSEAAFARITELSERMPRTAVLTGSADDPQICVDFAYMPAHLHTDVANAALAALRQAIEGSGRSVALAPGDVLIFDNRRCVHGREGFEARYDGTDRWLRRMNIARTLSTVVANQLTSRGLSIA